MRFGPARCLGALRRRADRRVGDPTVASEGTLGPNRYQHGAGDRSESRTCRARVTAASVALIAAVSAITPSSALAAGKDEHEERDDNIEHAIIIGVGGAAELEWANGSMHLGANLMIEWDAVEDWLELELDASLLSEDHGLEIPIGLLVKKPFRLTRRFEFMIGIGPEAVQVATPVTNGTFWGGQVALDFMFWPSHHVGLWVEPSYDVIFRDGVSHGIGTTGGLLLGW